MSRKFFAVAWMILSVTIATAASGQSLVPSDSAAVQMGTNPPPPPPPNGHLQVQYKADPQGNNQSWDSVSDST